MTTTRSMHVAIIGGGPAGLIAAETLIGNGFQVDLFDGMPSVGRKLLQAGKGGFNLTHSEPMETFVQKYGAQMPFFTRLLGQFGANELRAWAKNLGFETFVGSSGRVFPLDMKAAPLVRAWLHRLRESGVNFHVRHYWQGWDEQNNLLFSSPDGQKKVQAAATLLALGGASWPRLGSDGKWTNLLINDGIQVIPLKPANCGINIAWSDFFRQKFAGSPVKGITLSYLNEMGQETTRKGECVITDSGIEGSLIYPSIPAWRSRFESNAPAFFCMDLLPDRPYERVLRELSASRGSKSLSNHLRGQLGLDGVKTALLYEFLDAETMKQPAKLAHAIKSLRIDIQSLRPIEEAISSAGGLCMNELDEYLMLKQKPGTFCAGEMLDWEAPTGGYLLTGCFTTGVHAAHGITRWLRQTKTR
jgi:flavoprotein, HI0933 family/uncharacterized flavoprotein, PP_4765 family